MGLLNRKKIKEEKPAEQAEKIETVAEATKNTAGSIASSRIIVKPLITEKAAVAQSLNKYAFIVHRNATKEQVKKAVKDIYGETPTAVNLINVEGKKRRSGRNVGRRSDYKKAFVTLPKGKTIAIHEGV
jgi:large subunit ribosomal protein L23